MSVPKWPEWQLLGLHPDFRIALIPCLLEAQAAGLDPRYNNGPRPNSEQRRLRETYERQRELFARGKTTKRPLPAALPGASSHNYAVCSVNKSHRIGGAERCPKCDSLAIPASVAVDIWLAGVDGQAIYSGGSVPLTIRPKVWQDWAAVVANHPLLRDGGEFNTPDPVHVESLGWDFRTGLFTPPVTGIAA